MDEIPRRRMLRGGLVLLLRHGRRATRISDIRSTDRGAKGAYDPLTWEPVSDALVLLTTGKPWMPAST